jgi:hypothetical protein
MSISACQLSRLIEQSGCTFTGVVGEFGHYVLASQMLVSAKVVPAMILRALRVPRSICHRNERRCIVIVSGLLESHQEIIL